MAGALVAPPARRLAGFLPHLRPGLRSAWSSAWIDADPAFATNPANSKGAASTSRARQKKLSNRLSSVVEAVNDRKIPPELRGGADAVRSETDIINVVERRIWHSMEEGHFENLPGKGKPLKLSANPHADPAEDTLYRILSRNGCAPEWVELNKEIRLAIAEWRSALKKAWAKRSNHEHSGWLEDSQALKEQMRDINSKVLRYNLIAPFGRQVFGLKWEKEIDKLEQPITDASF